MGDKQNGTSKFPPNTLNDNIKLNQLKTIILKNLTEISIEFPNSSNCH